MRAECIQHAFRAGKHAPKRTRQFALDSLNQLVILCTPICANAHHAADLVCIRSVKAVQLIGYPAEAHQLKNTLIGLPPQLAAVGYSSIQIKDNQRRLTLRNHLRAFAAAHYRAFHSKNTLSIDLF